MKESYFKPDDLVSTAQAMMQEIFPDGQKRAGEFSRDRAAMLVLDMQEYFLNPESHAYVPSAPAILPGINRIAAKFNQKGRPLIYTQHLNTDRDAGSLKGWWRDLINESHPHRGLVASLDLKAGRVLVKTQYDAFYRTELEELLRAEGVEQVLISGVMTHLCCETTARSAFVRGFEVFFLVDGTASYTRDFHMATLRNLGHGFTTLVSSDQIERAFWERT